jgi:hypothetical protein
MCPLCHSKRVRRSRRQPLDVLLLILLAKPMRCRTCSYRYYLWPWSKLKASVPPDPQKLILRKPHEQSAAAGKP